MSHHPVNYDTSYFVLTELQIASNEYYLRDCLFTSFGRILRVTTPLKFLWRIFKIHLSIHDVRWSTLIHYRLRGVGRDSSVGIATGYGLDGPGIIYRMLLTMDTDVADTRKIRIIRKYPDIPWQRVWKTLHTAGLSDKTKSTWYAAIYDIIPAHERLAAINLVPTMTCSRCGETDTLQHRITRCEEGPVIWSWTRARLAAILRMHPKHIHEELTLRPAYEFRPAQKQAAITWIIVHLVEYRPQAQRCLSFREYLDFLRRARWKEYHRTPRSHTVDRYLDVL
jgi:hypothetical protein